MDHNKKDHSSFIPKYIAQNLAVKNYTHTHTHTHTHKTVFVRNSAAVVSIRSDRLDVCCSAGRLVDREQMAAVLAGGLKL